MLTRKHMVRYQWSKNFSISCMEIESINVLQFPRIMKFCHNFNISNSWNSSDFESLVFHVPWNFRQVKTLEISSIMEFHLILHNRIFTFCELLEYTLG